MGDPVHELQWEGIAYAVVAAAALMGLAVLFFFPTVGPRWLPLPRLRPGRWTGHDVFLAVCVFLSFGELIVTVLEQFGFVPHLLGPAPDPLTQRTEWIIYRARSIFISSPLILAVTLGMILALMFARSGSRPHHYGLTWSRWPINLGLGLIAFVLARPLVIGIYALTVSILGESADPFKALARAELADWEWALFAFQMTVAAPILEEIVCRGILMGWLRRATLAGHTIFLLFTSLLMVSRNVLIRYDTDAEAYHVNLGPAIFCGLLVAGYAFALYRLRQRFGLTEDETRDWQPQPSFESFDGAAGVSEEQARALREDLRRRDEVRLQAWADANATLAILGSAAFFALMHPIWPTPIPLFGMGLLLGWMARRTQSLLGPIVFHSLFNLTSFIALYGMVLYPAAPNGNAETTAIRPSVSGSMTIWVPASQWPLRR